MQRVFFCGHRGGCTWLVFSINPDRPLHDAFCLQIAGPHYQLNPLSSNLAIRAVSESMVTCCSVRSCGRAVRNEREQKKEKFKWQKKAILHFQPCAQWNGQMCVKCPQNISYLNNIGCIGCIKTQPFTNLGTDILLSAACSTVESD